MSLSNHLLINLIDLANEEDGLDKQNDPKETGYLGDAESSSREASAPQSSDSEDDISVRTKPKATATMNNKERYNSFEFRIN